MGDKRFEDEGGAGVQAALAERGPNFTVEVYMSEESEEKVTALQVVTQQGGSSKIESCQEI